MTGHVKPSPPRGKPGRQPAGHVEWTGRVWRVRVTTPEGRRWFALPTSLGPDDRDQAQALAKQIQEAARGAVPLGDVVTVASYAGRWIESLPPGPTRGTYSRALTGHVLPVLGAMDVRGVTSKDVRALVSKWDAAVAKGVQATNSVTGYWTACRLLFKSACASKRDDLRVRTDNPCAGVEGPTRSRIEVAHQWLFPSEFLAVMACLKISVKVRHWIALFVLTGCRLNELRGLRRRDIDLARDVVHIRCQRDPRTGALRPTKGKRARTIPLEPALRPLLEASQGEPDDHVLTVPKTCGGMLLRALRLAGVTRQELFERSDSSNPLRIHDLRGTYATWCALRGDPPLAIQRRLGHASLDETQGYLRAAELFGAKGEVPFPLFEIVLSVPGYVPAVPGALTAHREKGSNVAEGYNAPI
jgi:integrase